MRPLTITPPISGARNSLNCGWLFKFFQKLSTSQARALESVDIQVFLSIFTLDHLYTTRQILSMWLLVFVK